MKTIRTPRAMHAWSRATHAAGGTIAFVPTMGALHEGHLALVRRARRAADHVVTSVFVNPTQFGPAEDFARYPRAPARDARLLRAEGVAALFLPTVRGMYPRETLTRVSVPLLAEGLCGPFRPGHFDGVCLVVLQLLHIVEPDVLVLGQKDAQQVAILTRMVRDLHVPTRVVVAATVREPGGLALSSRNAYLSAADRAHAAGLRRAIAHGAERVAHGERRPRAVRETVRRSLDRIPGFRTQYVEVVDPETLHAPHAIADEALIAVAGFFGRTRLIDNARVRARAPRRRGRRSA